MRKGLAGFLLLLIGFAVVSIAQADVNNVRIVIPADVEVNPGMILLQHVATITGDSSQIHRLQQIELGEAPNPGQFRWITKNYIQYRLTQSGCSEKTVFLEMPERFRVVGLGIRLTSQMLLEQISAALAPKAPREWTSWEIIPNGNLTTYWLPPGPYQIEAETTEPKLKPGTNLLTVRIQTGEKLWRRMAMAVKIRAVAQVPVNSKDLDKHTILDPATFQWEERTITGQEIFRFPDGEQRTKHPLQRGEPLREGDLETVPLILKGSLITIQVKAGQTFVRVTGRALHDGGLGDIIPVQNISSRKIVDVVVTGPGKAEVRNNA